MTFRKFPAALAMLGLAFAPYSLSAETGFAEGRHFFELKGFSSVGVAGDVATDIRNLYQPDLPYINLLFPSGNPADLNLAFASRIGAEQPELASVGGSIEWNYASNSWFVLGASVTNSTFKAQNIRTLEAATAPVVNLVLSSPIFLLSGGFGSIIDPIRQLEIFTPLLLGDSQTCCRSGQLISSSASTSLRRAPLIHICT